MEWPSPQPPLDAVLAALGAEAHPDADRLATELQASARASDRHLPAAREWVRRWRPLRIEPQPLDCSCARGRCAACN